MSIDLQQTRPVAVVTGGSSNIGWACVRRFAATHEVLIADLKPPDATLPASVHFVPADVTDEAACEALFAAAAARGPLAALVHSAAITAPARPIEAIPVDEWRRLIEVNLTGAFLVAR
ncbi:MAG: SDR family oxidoreductase, partial [Burkholderiales bacterium]